MAEVTTGLVLFSLSLAVTGFALQRFLRQRRHGGDVRRDAWHAFAAERAWSHHADPTHPRLRGEHRGCTVEMAAEIRTTRGRYGRRVETADTAIRVPLRADVPRGLSVHRRSGIGPLVFRLLGGRPIAIDEDIDAFFVVTGREPLRTRELLSELAMKKALLRLVDVLPEARITEREIAVDVPGMVTDSGALDRYLDAITQVVLVLRALAPQAAIDPKTDDRALPTAAELPVMREKLASQLRRAGTAKLSGLNVATLKATSYDYTLEVRSVGEGITRLGIQTGGRLVRGLLERSDWRLELAFPADYNALVDILQPGDRVRGTLDVDDVRDASRTVEATSVGPPIPLPRTNPAPVPRGTVPAAKPEAEDWGGDDDGDDGEGDGDAAE